MKKVLIITYYWPPAGGPGVQRVLKFAKYLPDFGWQPIILTVRKGNFPSVDTELEKEIPESCKVFKTDIFEPFEFYNSLKGNSSKEKIPTFVLNKSKNEKLIDKAIRWIRANVFVPDAKIGWIKHMVNEGSKIINIEKPDLIFSSSPPHSLQIGAMKLAAKTNLPWVADFRDPWTDAFWQKDIRRIPFSIYRDKNYEKSVLNSANSIITISKSIAKDFEKNTHTKVNTISNGFDEDDFRYTKKRNPKFSICYTGTLGKDQSLSGFIKSLESLPGNIKENTDINFIGSFHPTIMDMISASQTKSIFHIKDSVLHSESTRLISNADMLLLIIPDTKNNKGILTGKIFEYLATKNPILGYGPIDGDAAEILNQTNCGKMFEHVSNSSKYILETFNTWEKHIPFNPNGDLINQYSRKSLTQVLSRIFSEMT